ncbi:hypothetical protein FRC06_003524, partial [Ceratobasidium sp. 370]
MPSRDWTWAFFVKGKKKYGNNKTNYSAYCAGCIAHYLESLELADQQAVAEGGNVTLVRSKGEIYKEACKLAKPMCGHPATFRLHIWNCPYVSQEAKERPQSLEEANPLAVALNVAQAADTHLDHILITLGNLYRILSALGINNEFLAEAWHLERYCMMYEKEDKPINLVALWSTLPNPGTTNSGRHQLSCLAKLILSVVANSAGAERLFSYMGHIHSKRRNRMHHTKVHDLVTLAIDLDAQHRAAGFVRKQARWHFDQGPSQLVSEQGDCINNTEPNGDPDAASEASDDEDEDEIDDDEAAVDLKALAARLTEAANEGDDPKDPEHNEDLLSVADLVGQRPNPQPRVGLFF